MGYYTELIFGASFKEDVPEIIIAIIKAMIEGKAKDIKEVPNHPFFAIEGWEYLMTCSSFDFGVNKAVAMIWFDDIDKVYHVSTRSNVADYFGEIEAFLDWIKPFLRSGSGEREIYAIVIEEGLSYPRIYTLKEQSQI